MAEVLEHKKKILSKSLEQLNISLSLQQEQQLWHYIELLKKWNRFYNLTAITETDAVIQKHLLDSLATIPFLKTGRWLDVGTGAGFPGIPLAIALPQMRWFLLDSANKRIQFLTHALQQLKIKNVELVLQRVEQYQAETLFDGIISRAFTRLAEMVTKTEHLLAKDGYWLAMKGQYPDDELAELPKHITVLDVKRLVIPGLIAERHAVLLSLAHDA